MLMRSGGGASRSLQEPTLKRVNVLSSTLKTSHLFPLCCSALLVLGACGDDSPASDGESGSSGTTGSDDSDDGNLSVSASNGDDDDSGGDESTGSATTAGDTTDGGSDTGTTTGADGCIELTIDELLGTDIGVPIAFNDTISVGEADVPDLFRIEFYDDETGTFDLSMAPEDDYATCTKCVRLFEDDDGMTLARQYYQSEGTLEIAAETPPSSLAPTLTFTGVRLVEVTISDSFVSTPVEGGQCVDIVDGTVETVELVEICGNDIDDDGNGVAECGDPACAADPICTGPCTDDTTEASLGDNAGDTTGGSNVFQSSCNDFGGLENLWTFTPATDGLHLVTLTSATDQSVAVRGTCEDILTQLTCAEDVDGGELEETGFIATNGEAVTLIVDGDGAGTEGAYTLSIAETTLNGETEPNDAFGDAEAVADDGFTGTIEADGGEDWFSVEVPAGQSSIRARTFGQAAACEGNTIVRIYDTDGTTELVQDINSGPGPCSDAVATALTAGDTYFVQVVAADGMASFDYSVVISTE